MDERHRCQSDGPLIEAMALVVMMGDLAKLANELDDGHLTIMRFTTGWKACLGTPEPFREEVDLLPKFVTLEHALGWAIQDGMARLRDENQDY